MINLQIKSINNDEGKILTVGESPERPGVIFLRRGDCEARVFFSFINSRMNCSRVEFDWQGRRILTQIKPTRPDWLRFAIETMREIDRCGCNLSN